MIMGSFRDHRVALFMCLQTSSGRKINQWTNKGRSLDQWMNSRRKLDQWKNSGLVDGQWTKIRLVDGKWAKQDHDISVAKSQVRHWGRSSIVNLNPRCEVKAVLGSYSSFLLASYHDFMTLYTMRQVPRPQEQPFK